MNRAPPWARYLSLRTRLLIALLFVGLLALLTTGWQASRRAEASLRQAATNQLTSIRAERTRQISAYFAAVRRDAAWIAESREIAAAMLEFRDAYRDLAPRVARWPEAVRERHRAAVERFYTTAVVPRLRALGPENDAESARRVVPQDDVALALQSMFVVDTGDPDAGDRLGGGPDGRRYAMLHARTDASLRAMAHRFGFDDLFLIDAEDGRILYTVAKKVDFGTDLLTGPYRNTRLSRAFRAARTAAASHRVKLVDFDSYAPALGAPAAFVSAPIFDDGHRIGVVAFEISLDRIDAVMTGERRWEGLGRTGETYLVGPDHRMRSDSRFFLERPDEYLATVARTGVPEDMLDLMRTHRRTVLFQQVTGPAAQAALHGQSGLVTYVDYRQEPVLASYAPVDIEDLRWGLVAKLDVAEAFAPAVALRRWLIMTAAVIAAVVVIIAVLLARSLTSPIRRLIAGMGTLGRGDLAYRLVETRRDEIGQIADAFNRMAHDLQETTVTRDHVRGILNSMSDAVMVVRPPNNEPDWHTAVVVTVNPAACTMLGRPEREVVGKRIGEVIADIAAAADHGPAALSLEEVLRDGRMGAREVVYKIHDGREIPVLFSSARIGAGATAVGDIVCAAHDLTELKATAARTAFIRETFGRYVSDDVVASLLSSPQGLQLGGELRTITVMMSDLRGFTHLAARLTPERAIEFLNRYLQTMVELILQQRGTINEIMGDGILVIFGAPSARPDDAERAVACAVAMQRAMTDVNAWNRRHGVPDIEMGVGIQTGPAIVGNIGSHRRMKYAAVGTTVNLAGRIETFTTGGQILISDSTRREAGDSVRVGRALRIEPKGASAPLTVWDVTGAGEHDLLTRDEQMLPLASELPVRYAVVENKLVRGAVLEGRLTCLSAHGAEIHTAEPPPPLTDVKIWMGADDADEVYAKVVDVTPAGAPGFVVRFTSTTPAIRRGLSLRIA